MLGFLTMVASLIVELEHGLQGTMASVVAVHGLSSCGSLRLSCPFSSVQSLSHVQLFATPWSSMPGFPVHHQLLELVQTHVHWVSDAIQPSHPVIPFSSCLQSFPALGSFPMSQFFTSGGQSIGVSASGSVLPMNIQDWFSWGLTGLISLQSKGLTIVFFNIQKHQFFGAQLSLESNSHIHTWLLEKP